MVWAPLRRRVRALFAREGVPVTPQQREYIAQVLLFPVRRARDDSAVLAAHLYNGEAARHGVDPIGKPQVQFYPRGALESVLERAAAPKVTVEGLDKLGAHPARVRVDGLDGLGGSVAGVRIEGLDDFGTALEHARVDIDESNRRDPQVVEQVVRRTERAVVRHVEQAARDTIKTAVENEQDRRNKMLGRDRERAKVEKAVGWARVLTGLESCGFCAMLASRGPVYGTEWLAQHRGRNQQENKYHDGCDCLIVPVFDSNDWIGMEAYDELEQLWIESDGRKDFEKRFRQIRKNGDVEKYVGAVDPTSSGGDPPDRGSEASVAFDDDPDDAEGIEREFSEWAQQRTTDEVVAVERWQGTDRFYQRVQRPKADDSEARAIRDAMEDLAYSHELAEDRQLWRGIRSCDATFGVQSSDLESLVGREFTPNQFTAATPAREVAEREFSQPSLRGGNAMIRIRARKGTPAAYLAPIGDSKLAYQREVVFPPGMSMRIVGVDRSGPLPVVVVDLWRSV